MSEIALKIDLNELYTLANSKRWKSSEIKAALPQLSHTTASEGRSFTALVVKPLLNFRLKVHFYSIFSCES